jgi:hypothetical protein
MQKLGEPEILCLFLREEKWITKISGKVLCLSRSLHCFLLRRFGNPLQKFFCGFGFVEFLMRSAPLPKGDGGVSSARWSTKGEWGFVWIFPIFFSVQSSR